MYTLSGYASVSITSPMKIIKSPPRTHSVPLIVFVVMISVVKTLDARTFIIDYPMMRMFEHVYRVQVDQPRISKKTLLSYQREIEICPSTTVWKNLTRAQQASDGKNVEIVQDPEIGHQWFYTVSCKADYENKPCRLIDNSYKTTCRTRYNLVPAFIHTPDKPEPFGFTMIKIPGQCVCVETTMVDVEGPGWLDVRGDPNQTYL